MASDFELFKKFFILCQLGQVDEAGGGLGLIAKAARAAGAPIHQQLDGGERHVQERQGPDRRAQVA